MKAAKGFAHILLLIGIVAIIVLLGFNKYIDEEKKQIIRENPLSISSTPIPVADRLTNTTTNPQTTEESKTYSSNQWGITFKYAPEYLGLSPTIVEDGNKIYVGNGDYLPQYVEVITTEKGLTIEEDIRNRYLKGFPSYCELTLPSDKFPELKPAQDNFKLAVIAIPHDDITLDEYAERMSYCPSETTTTGFNFFIYDPTNTEKYLYFSIGHEPPWPASTTSYDKEGDQLNWMQTIQFVD